MMTIADENKQAILREVVTLSVPPLIQPGDITADEYVLQVKQERGIEIGRQAATAWLNKLVREGKLETEKVLDPKRTRRVRVWRQVAETE